MKKIWVYLLGLLSGIVITIVVLLVFGLIIRAKNDPGITMLNGMSFFETPGEVIKETSFKVFQALDDGAALAEGKGDGHSSVYLGLNVLLYNEEKTPYYDEQIVTLPQGKCFRQVGIYRYHAKSGIDKTVPIVMIMDK
jgi:hypothetical protein